MTPNAIQIAEMEAERFLARCKAAKEAFSFHKFDDGTGGYWSNDDTKATGALRRASMDLTRALADLRRPRP
jgi:hypothetical protein